jgi:hypothetical protein
MNERNRGDSHMNERKTENPPVDTKKVWTAPVLEVILLNSAEHTARRLIADGTGTRKS